MTINKNTALYIHMYVSQYMFVINEFHFRNKTTEYLHKDWTNVFTKIGRCNPMVGYLFKAWAMLSINDAAIETSCIVKKIVL